MQNIMLDKGVLVLIQRLYENSLALLFSCYVSLFLDFN